MSDGIAPGFSAGAATDVDFFTISNWLQPDQSDADTSRVGTIVGTSIVAHGVHGASGSSASAHQLPAPQLPTGVWGESDSGFGVFGYSGSNSGVLGASAGFDGVHGESQSAAHAGIAGINRNGGIGVYGASYGGSGNAGQFDGNVTVTGTITAFVDILLKGGSDCAEQFDVGGADRLEPGMVVVFDEQGALRQSQGPYDKKVAGVISGAGECKPGLILDARPCEHERATLALVGKAYCRVDAKYSPIEVGDLLTTSPTPGFAMKADDPIKAFGAVFGKALRPLASGQGLIPILITLR